MKINYNNEDLKSHDGVCALIRNGSGDVLVMDHVKFGCWTIPLGKAKPGQSVLEALYEEIGEELGIIPGNPQLLGNFKKTYMRDGNTVNVTSYLFLIDVWSGKVKNLEPDKHRSIKWMPAQQFLQLSNTTDSSNFAKQYV